MLRREGPPPREAAIHIIGEPRPGTKRLVGAAVVGATVGVFVLLCFISRHPPHTDFDQIHAGARAVLGGDSPYASVRHDRYPNYYPLTAFLVAMPVVGLRLVWAQVLWATFGAAAFAFAVSRRGAWGLLALASAPFLNAVLLGQWSPLLAGASAIPWLAFVWAAKPTIGAALFAGYPSRRAAVLCVALLAVPLAVRPHWPAEWLDVIRVAPHVRAPIARPGGILLLLGLFRWRTPEGRLIATLSLVPQTSMAYEILPVFLIPRTAREMGALVLLSQIAFAVCVSLPGIDPSGDLAGTLTRQWPVWLVACYLPAVVMVLRRPRVPGGGRPREDDAMVVPSPGVTADSRAPGSGTLSHPGETI